MSTDRLCQQRVVLAQARCQLLFYSVLYELKKPRDLYLCCGHEKHTVGGPVNRCVHVDLHATYENDVVENELLQKHIVTFLTMLERRTREDKKRRNMDPSSILVR
jgi:hypothetical protein